MNFSMTLHLNEDMERWKISRENGGIGIPESATLPQVDPQPLNIGHLEEP